jgi:hypothetical protein
MQRLATAAAMVMLVLSPFAAPAQTQPAAAADGRGAVDVSVDPRVELFSIIFYLAGSPEYTQSKAPTYVQDVEEKFGSFREHDVVKLAQELRKSRGIGFDAPMSLAVHLKPGASLELAMPIEPLPATLDKRWRREDVENFLRDATDLARAAKFEEFFDAHRELYDHAAQRMRDTLAQHAKLNWFDEFFGTRSEARFHLILGMLNGGCCYGPRATVDRRQEMYCILGVWNWDGAGEAQFPESVVPTIIHEFCHSYANPCVDRHLDQLKDIGDRLVGSARQRMRRQGYGTGDTVLYESLVRACVARYRYANEGPDAGDAEVHQQEGLGFAWMPQLSDCLAEYETHRDQYSSLEAFMPKIVECLKDAADKLPQK